MKDMEIQVILLLIMSLEITQEMHDLCYITLQRGGLDYTDNLHVIYIQLIILDMMMLVFLMYQEQDNLKIFLLYDRLKQKQYPMV